MDGTSGPDRAGSDEPTGGAQPFSGDRCRVVAEVGNVHEGSLGNCHSFIDAVADAGADGVKFQCHISAAESSADEGWPKRFFFHPQDQTRWEYWRRMEITREGWEGLANHARHRDLLFIVTPFCVPAIERIVDLVDAIKIGSGQTTDWPFVRAVADAGKPVILSTGMSSAVEIERARRMLKDVLLATLQCTTEYPCPPEHVGLNKVWDWDGLSDHSGTIYPGICAAYLGALLVEVHVCWDRRQFGADVSSSLTIDELSQLVEGVRFAKVMRKNPVCKNKILKELDDTQVYIKGKRIEHAAADPREYVAGRPQFD